LGSGPKADAFSRYLEPEDNLVVPSIVLYEVHRKLLLTGGKKEIDRFLSHALRGQQAALDADLAREAAHISFDHKLAMADAIIYATALRYKAELITADPDFRGLPGVLIPQ